MKWYKIFWWLTAVMILVTIFAVWHNEILTTIREPMPSDEIIHLEAEGIASYKLFDSDQLFANEEDVENIYAILQLVYLKYPETRYICHDKEQLLSEKKIGFRIWYLPKQYVSKNKSIDFLDCRRDVINGEFEVSMSCRLYEDNMGDVLRGDIFHFNVNGNRKIRLTYHQKTTIKTQRSAKK